MVRIKFPLKRLRSPRIHKTQFLIIVVLQKFIYLILLLNKK
jgi:hypothetical protein